MHEGDSAAARRFFLAVTARPRAVLAVAALSILGFGAFIPTLTKDTRNEAYMDQEHPAVVYRDRVKELFGLQDPMIIAVVDDGPHGVFTPHGLRLVQWLTERVARVPGIDPDRVTSLATEKNITGTAGGMRVELFFEAPPETQAEADRVRTDVLDVPLYVGKLASEDGTTALIVAELLDQDDAEAIYRRLLEVAGEAPATTETIHVAGEGATNGYVAAYIDEDASRLNPIAFLVIAAVLALSYRTLRGVVLPLFVVLGALAWSLGSMAALGVPFYAITNALTVALIGISVADGIHILGQFYEEAARRPRAPARELAVESLVHMWRPVTFTSLTSAAGFLALCFASPEPPMRKFGAFAGVGIGAAWAFSLIALPALLTLMRPRGSSVFTRRGGVDGFGRLVELMGRRVLARPRLTLAATVAVISVCALAAADVQIEDYRITYFQRGEPIRVADEAINRSMDGTSTLEIVVEADETDALMRPDHLRRIDALQRYAEEQPLVGGTLSLVDYVKLMNRAVNEDRADAYAIPDSVEAVAQLFLLYEAGSDPGDFEEVVEPTFRRANVRVRMTRGRWSDTTRLVTALQRFIDERFNRPGLHATLAGSVNVTHHRAEALRRGHPLGVALSFVSVLVVAAVSFRSVVAGVSALLPVALSMLLVYGVMGGLDIWIGNGTAMTVAIAIGLAVDFSVHTLDRLIVQRSGGASLEEGFERVFPTTGRALLFNLAAVTLGFGVLATSKVPALQNFGLLVGVCVAGSFLGTLTALPPLLRLGRPAFLGFPRRRSRPTSKAAARSARDHASQAGAGSQI